MFQVQTRQSFWRFWGGSKDEDTVDGEVGRIKDRGVETREERGGEGRWGRSGEGTEDGRRGEGTGDKKRIREGRRRVQVVITCD